MTVGEQCGFPRWDGPTEAAYERARWRFDGPLPSAVETPGSDPDCRLD